MKKLLVTSALIGVLAPSIALADTKNFEGFSAGLNLNLISAAVKISGDGGYLDGIGGKQAQSASVDVGYGIKIGNAAVITVGLDADLTKPEFYSEDSNNGTATGKLKSRYGVYFAPGVVINKETLLYGKVSYNRLKGEVTGDDSVAGGGPYSDSLTFNGVGYGVGAKIMISKNTFLKVEANRQTFSSKATIDATWKPSATVGTIGIGMQF